MSNKIFTKNKKVELDSNWYLTPDSDSGIVLVFHEPRERKNKKTDELEGFLYEEKTYHPRMAQAIKYFVDKTQNESKTLDELMTKIDYNTSLLEKLNREFIQFE